MIKRKPATETCLFCGRKIPDRSNAEAIREFVQRFKKIARKTELIDLVRNVLFLMASHRRSWINS